MTSSQTPSSSTPQLSVIIVSYNTRDMTLKCLRTLFDNLGGISAEVWVVDNASHDGSVEAIRQEFPDVLMVANEGNAGFGEANNQAMQQARGQWFLLLNSDAFVHEGAISSLIEYSKAHPEAGVVGPKLLNADGSLQRSCYRFPSPGHAWRENLWISVLVPPSSRWSDLRRWSHDGERQVDFVIGACLLLRRAVFEQVGGFDERFWMYSEETDWQQRMAQKGWKVMFVPQAVVTHLGGASGANEKVRINESFFESLDYYEWKHYGMRGLVSMRLAMAFGCLLRTVLWTMAAFVPGRRKQARAKSKMQAWLVVRQLTRWKLPLKDKAAS